MLHCCGRLLKDWTVGQSFPAQIDSSIKKHKIRVPGKEREMTKRAMASASTKTLVDFFKPSTKRHKATISSSSQTLEIPVPSRTSFPCVSSSMSAADSGFLKQKVDHDDGNDFHLLLWCVFCSHVFYSFLLKGREA